MDGYWFSRCCTARGSSTDLCWVGPTKVKASKSILFTEGSPEVEINVMEIWNNSLSLQSATICLSFTNSS